MARSPLTRFMSGMAGFVKGRVQKSFMPLTQSQRGKAAPKTKGKTTSRPRKGIKSIQDSVANRSKTIVQRSKPKLERQTTDVRKVRNLLKRRAGVIRHDPECILMAM